MNLKIYNKISELFGGVLLALMQATKTTPFGV